ncbi:MAG: RNA methyltransferase [Armatimonadetes bacterium]|nr:RNA methyltransferase [Armatimonadota bacterium]MDW8121469.1 RNA methyltransferase [Armatimonadota bacterium]
MWIYGRHPVREALRAGILPQVVFVAEGSQLPEDFSKELSRAGIKVRSLPREKLTQIVRTDHHQGIVADIGPFPLASLEQLLERAFQQKGVIVGLDHWQDPGNVGSIIRTAYALGATGLLIPAGRSAPLLPAVVKASAGACFHILISQGNLLQFLTRFQKEGGKVVALDLEGQDIRKSLPERPTLLVIGAEGPGLSPKIRERADLVWTIPMKGTINSLGAVAAATIALWELLQER